MKKKSAETGATNSQELFHDPSKRTPDKEEWDFNREITIQRLVAISKTRAERHTINHAIHEEDRIPERVLKNPLPHNEYVDFYDDSDLALVDLTQFCDRLAVRKKTLEFHRAKVANADWSSEQKQEIALIDKALDLIDHALDNPTEGPANLEKCAQRYENYLTETSRNIPDVHQPYSSPGPNHQVFSPPPKKPSESALFICEIGNEFVRQKAATPSARQLWDAILSCGEDKCRLAVKLEKGKLVVEEEKISWRGFRDRHRTYSNNGKANNK